MENPSAQKNIQIATCYTRRHSVREKYSFVAFTHATADAVITFNLIEIQMVCEK